MTVAAAGHPRLENSAHRSNPNESGETIQGSESAMRPRNLMDMRTSVCT